MHLRIITILVLYLAIYSYAFAGRCVNPNDLMSGIGVSGDQRDIIDIYFSGRKVRDYLKDGSFLRCQNGSTIDPVINLKTPPVTIPGTNYYSYLTPGYATAKIGQDVFAVGTQLVVRHGRDRDIVRLYGMRRDAGKRIVAISRLAFTPRDGKLISIRNGRKGSVIIVYGRDKDLRTRFCFDGHYWTRSPGNARKRGLSQCKIRADGTKHVVLHSDLL